MIFSQISSVISLSKYLHNCRQKASDGNAELRIAQEKKWDQRFLAVGCQICQIQVAAKRYHFTTWQELV